MNDAFEILESFTYSGDEEVKERDTAPLRRGVRIEGVASRYPFPEKEIFKKGESERTPSSLKDWQPSHPPPTPKDLAKSEGSVALRPRITPHVLANASAVPSGSLPFSDLLRLSLNERLLLSAIKNLPGHFDNVKSST